ncbi:MAG: hypothetical protein C4310_12500, partial [Chloroflexota bacterium]
QASPPRLVSVTISRSGDPERDRERLARVYEILVDFQGNDQFQLILTGEGRTIALAFPNNTTCACEALERRLHAELGP